MRKTILDVKEIYSGKSKLENILFFILSSNTAPDIRESDMNIFSMEGETVCGKQQSSFL